LRVARRRLPLPDGPQTDTPPIPDEVRRARRAREPHERQGVEDPKNCDGDVVGTVSVRRPCGWERSDSSAKCGADAEAGRTSVASHDDVFRERPRFPAAG